MNSPWPKFEIFILSYNRADQLREAVSSWIAQDLTNSRLIVSDNSSNESVSEMMAKEFPNVEIRRRRPSLPAREHFELARSEAQSPWFMLFHDDDIMLARAFKNYEQAASEHPTVAAIAGNAVFMRNGNLTKEKVNASLTSDRLITKVEEFSEGYFHPIGQLQPFPGYLYNRAATRHLFFDFKKARKYSDFIYLSEVAETGPILWLKNIVMATRIHAGNDSGDHDIRAVILVRRRLIARKVFKARDRRLQLYRMWNYLLHVRKVGSWKKPWTLNGREKTIAFATAMYFIRNPEPLLSKVFSRIQHYRF